MIRILKLAAGIAFCTTIAALLIVYLRDVETIRLAAPAICLQAVIVTAIFSGRIPALIGAVLASAMFAIWLFPPHGSLTIQDPVERIVLALFLVTAFIVIRISPRSVSFNRQLR